MKWDPSKDKEIGVQDDGILGLDVRIEIPEDLCLLSYPL